MKPSADSALHARLQELESELAQQRAVLAQLSASASDGLDSEMKDARAKLRIITTKFANVRKERDQLKQANEQLQVEILDLQASMRQMVPGLHPPATAFASPSEIAQATDQFYKCECQDVFFELLAPELSTDGITFFFKTHYSKLREMVKSYFSAAEQQLRQASTLDSLEGPIMNVLRKSYQAKWKVLYDRCRAAHTLRIVQDMQSVLQLGEGSSTTLATLKSFADKLGELLFCYHISDPPIACMWENIGDQAEYSALLHEAVDGFLRPGDLCIVMLPCVYKASGELLNKAAVLPVEYELAS